MMRSKVVGDFLDPDTDKPRKKSKYIHVERGDKFPEDHRLVVAYGYAFQPADG